MELKERLLNVLVEGLLWGLYYWLLFAIVLPKLVNRFLGGLVEAEAAPGGEFMGLVFLFFGLSLAATALKGTLYAPLVKALESILGFAIVAYFLNGGVVSATINYGGQVTVVLDLSPILYEIFLFFTVPGVVLPFVEYFLQERSE